MAKPPQVLTANLLRDGDVVYWRRAQWVGTLARADVFFTADEADAALAGAGDAVRDRLVVTPYLFAVRVDGGSPHPIEEREIIRAAGPTVRPDLGKQARHVPL